jgi:hypothetical protein
MQEMTLRAKLLLLVAATLVFGGVAWLTGNTIGNAGAWLILVLAIGWPATLGGGRRCLSRR